MIKIKASISSLLLFIFLIMASTANASEIQGKKILFIHHSTGGNLIKEGKLRDEIKRRDKTAQLWDHNYNLFPLFTSLLANNTHLRGLTDNNGTITGSDYNIVVSNNSPKEYAEIFQRDASDPTLKAILSYDIIAFKNCYPTTRIVSEQQLEEDMKYYKEIRVALAKYPTKQFVLLTPPPARKITTNGDNAKRAQRLVVWLKSDEFLQGAQNIHVFDFFGYLADDNGYLKSEYERLLPWDSHPNAKANATIAPLFAEYLASMK